jgi:hypothetical protein
MAIPEPKWQCFEDEVYKAVKKALASGYFPFEGNVKVLRGATYPGLTPGSTINIEVSIEAYREGASEPFLIWLWECKDKDDRKVEVGDVRELYSKLQEIGVSRAIGSLATTIGFQQGALELAKKLGISLYLLKKKLVPLMQYERGAEATPRPKIIAEYSMDFLGDDSAEAFFDHSLKADFGHLLARTSKQPDRADPWESLKSRLNDRPIHAGDLHFTREELHERS